MYFESIQSECSTQCVRYLDMNIDVLEDTRGQVMRVVNLRNLSLSKCDDRLMTSRYYILEAINY